jgi:hypothetical protein
MHFGCRGNVGGLVAIVACSAMVVVTCGCGGDPYQYAPVRGRVTCNDKPAAGGVIIFQPIDSPDKTGRPAGHSGSASSATIGEDGSFTLKSIDGASEGALIGPHQVIFQAPPTKRPTLTAEDRASMTPEELKRAEAEIASRKVYPPLACSTNVAPGEVEVQPGENDFTFTLQPK